MESLLVVFGIDWKLLIAQSINFLILLAGLSYFLYKPVLRLLKTREEKIAKGVKDAEVAALARAKTEEEKGSILRAAEKDAEGVMRRAEEEAKKEREVIVRAAQARSDALMADARAQAEELKRQALRESEKKIAQTAILAAEKILKEQS